MSTTRRDGHRPQRSIATRVMVLVAAGTTATLILLGLVTWSELRRAEQMLYQDRLGLATLASHEIDRRLQVMLSALQRLANDARTTDPLLDAGPGLDAKTNDAWYAAQLDGVVVMTLSGRVWARAPAGHAQEQAVVAEVVSRIRRSPRPWVFSHDRSPRSSPRVIMAVPLWSWRGDLVGVVVGDIEPQGRRFVQVLGAFAHEPSAPVIVSDENHAVLYPLEPHRPASPGALAGAARVSMAPWQVVVHKPESGVPSEGLRTRLLWLGALMIAGSLLLAWGAAWSVRRPLEELTRAASRLADGDLTTPVTVREFDEVGRLGDAFETMRQALHASRQELSLVNEALERRVEARTNELERANIELQGRERAQQVLLRKVITAQEDERKRIARELHDEACQTVTALGLRLDTLIASAQTDAETRSALTRARALSGQSLDELHRLIGALRPPLLDDMGLVAALRYYTEHLDAKGLAIRFESSVEDVSLPAETETALFRATQEALTNVVRHAEAEMVLVQLSADGRALSIEIEDDGVGFDPASLPPTPNQGRGLGLMGMRERLDLIGGRAEVRSAPGHGTHVVITIPWPTGARP